jgi:hypothetical protein
LHLSTFSVEAPSYSTSSSSSKGNLRVRLGGPIHHSWIVPLGSRENVSSGRFYSAAGNPDRGIIFTFFSDGYFQPYYGVRGFIGFRFNTGKGTQYGWARIKTASDMNYRVHDEIKDYAWGDPGEAILTGQKQSLQPANANSVPGSLGLWLLEHKAWTRGARNAHRIQLTKAGLSRATPGVEQLLKGASILRGSRETQAHKPAAN